MNHELAHIQRSSNTHARRMGMAVALVISAAVLLIGAWRFFNPPRPATHAPRRIPILMYHDLSVKQDAATLQDVWTVQAANFEKHLRFLRAQGYTSILPRDLVAAARSRKKLPAKPVIITFDDGFQSALTLAEPLLQKYGFNGIVYLITSKVADTPEQRQFYRAAPCLTWPEVRAMWRRGTLVFGSHTHTHPKRLPDIAAEMTVSRDFFRARTGARPDSFCYPHGQYNDDLMQAARDADYTTAMICEDEVAVLDAGINLFALPRVSVFGGAHRFTVHVMTPEQAGPGNMGCIVSNQGRPVRVAPRLRGADMPESDTWLPETRLGPAPQEWRWPVKPETDLKQLRLEIWDRNRILLLFTAP